MGPGRRIDTGPGNGQVAYQVAYLDLGRNQGRAKGRSRII